MKLRMSSTTFKLRMPNSILKMLTKREWCKLWKRRQKRLQFYKALYAFQKRNQFSLLIKATKRKQKIYKKRLNSMYKQRFKALVKKLASLKKQIIKFQLKYGIYDE